MSKYKVNKYVQDKWNGIIENTPMNKAYVLGYSQGCFVAYKHVEKFYGEEIADKVWEDVLNGTDEVSITFADLVRLDSDNSNSKVENMIETLQYEKQY